ncbi:hypothetical protein BU23DRAFT_664276 [Bimuria novae-zelandiae CBS 107.79]|uniref:Uncharacterized protein n=1 Tax=Bimuria novae-zelandiae CBS 107.79 TaxID=1447943 RepID=A0A6A5UMC2_9PLEO|nr:hypothetical protein BU23DRAFT_664276 [Bimuria novae-zelandiae CBS 107.79]
MRERQLRRRRRRRGLKRQLSAPPRSLPATQKKLYNYPKDVRERLLSHLHRAESVQNVLLMLQMLGRPQRAHLLPRANLHAAAATSSF